MLDVCAMPDKTGIQVYSFWRFVELFRIPVPFFADILVPVFVRLYFLGRPVMLILTTLHIVWSKLYSSEHRKIHTICLSSLISLTAFIYTPLFRFSSGFSGYAFERILYFLRIILPALTTIYIIVLLWCSGKIGFGQRTVKDMKVR